MGLRPEDLFDAASVLVRRTERRPKDAYLRRAVSTTYYALFHILAQTCADLVVGTKGADRSNPAWKQVYRSLQHGTAKNACKNTEIMTRFPEDVQDFANTFLTLQQLREEADYDPDARFAKSDVVTLITDAMAVAVRFRKSPVKDRRAFAAWVLFQRARR